jgi:hypothetical protein
MQARLFIAFVAGSLVVWVLSAYVAWLATRPIAVMRRHARH